MARHGRRTAQDQRRRHLGQNFLVDPRAIDRIIDLASPAGDDLIVDLGAGRGALTVPLSSRAGRVIAVERDRRWAASLRRVAAEHNNVEVVESDLMRVPLPLEPFRVVASPPFNLSTRLLRHLLGADVPLRDATLVLQLEAARRLTGHPRTGRFSLAWSPWYHLDVPARVDRRAFRPVPGVDAGVLTAKPRAVPLLSPARFAAWDGFVEQVFAAPGDTTGDRLARTDGARAAARATAASGLEPGRPPSRVPAAIWIELFRSLRAPRSSCH